MSSLTALLATEGITAPPVKLEVIALPEANYLLNWMYFEGTNTTSYISVLTYTRRLKMWSIVYVMKESKEQLEYRKLGHVEPVLGEKNMPWNLYPIVDGRELEGCQDIIFFMEDDLREFVLCPQKFYPDPSNQNISKIQYQPFGGCFQYLPPWHADPHDDRHIFSMARQDSSGLLTMVDDDEEITLMYMGTLKNCLPLRTNTSSHHFDQCVPCVLQCLGTGGAPAPLQDGEESPELLVPDSGTGRLMAYSCHPAVSIQSEAFPPWLTAPRADVTECVFTIFEVSDISHSAPVVPVGPPIHTSPSFSAPAAKAPSSGHNSAQSSLSQAQKSSRTKRSMSNPRRRRRDSMSSPIPTSPSAHTAPPHTELMCSSLPPIPWMTELVVQEPLTLTLAANRTVRLSYNADLLYATHFTRDGISSVSAIDVSNGGVFEQGSLPLTSDDVAGSVVNSFSDDIDRENQFLYVVGYYFNYTTDTSTPAFFRYDVSPRGQPSLLSQIYIESRSGVTPTSNYMVPVPHIPGMTVVAAPREVLIKHVSASSLALNGRYITSQYTSSELLDVNVVRPILSPDGNRILVFCQTLGMGHLPNILSAYVLDIEFKRHEYDDPHEPSSSVPHSVPTGHLNSQDVQANLRRTFGKDAKLEMDEFNRQFESYQAQVRQPAGPNKSGRSFTAFDSSSPPPSAHTAPTMTHPPLHGEVPVHISPITSEPDNPNYNDTYSVNLNLRCRFWISNNTVEQEQPIGGSFVDGYNNNLLIMAYTSLAVGSAGTTINIYDLTTCTGAVRNSTHAISYRNLTIIPPIATSHADIVWDSLPFADNTFNSDLQTGDSPGVRFWDIPTFRLDDGAITFWLSNQSLNIGIGHVKNHTHDLDPSDYESSIVQYVWNAKGISVVSVSDPIPCSPVTSQVVPMTTPLPPEIPVNQTTVWVLCQSAAVGVPSEEHIVAYDIMSWHFTSPAFPDLPTTPIEGPERLVDDDAHKTFRPAKGRYRLATNSIEMNSASLFADEPSTVDGPYIVNDTASWFMDIGTNLSASYERWEKSAIMNFFVQWDDRRLYFGNAQSYHIVAITEPNNHAVLFGRALFTSAQLVNSLVAWSQFSGFGFLGDVQWIWVISECASGTAMASTGYCSKCRPGSFGLGCGLCTAGYMCDGFGLLVPSSLCIEGSYCEAGSSQFQTGTSPQICPAGSYCPGGVASVNFGAVNSARRCGPGYYCPANTSVANPPEYKCPPNSLSDEGASTIDDCVCYETHIGSSGNCRKLPMNAKRILWGKEAVMMYEVGYFPAGNGTVEGVQYLERCSLNPSVCNGHVNPNISKSSSAPNVPRTVCKYVCNKNSHGAPSDHAAPDSHHKKSSGSGSSGGSHHVPDCVIQCDWATECHGEFHDQNCGWQAICEEGYEARMCSRCAPNYYERGHTCSPCSEQVEHRKVRSAIFFAIGAAVILALLGLVVIGQTFIALILELLSMVALNMIGLVPVWLLDVLLIFILVYFINRGKRYNTLIKMQEGRAAKRRLRKRAKRMAQKRREARARATARATVSNSGSARSILSSGSMKRQAEAARGTHSAHSSHRRLTLVVPPTDDELRVELGLPIDAVIDHDDPEVREVERNLIAARQALSTSALPPPDDGTMDYDDGPLPVFEDFMVLPSDEEGYISTIGSDTDDGTDDLGDELDDMEGDDDDDEDYDDDDDGLLDDSSLDEETYEEENLRAALSSPKGSAVLRDDDGPRAPSAQSSHRRFPGNFLSPVSHKGLGLAGRPAPHKALLGSSHYDRAFEQLAGHEEHAHGDSHGRGPSHDSHSAKEGHGGHGGDGGHGHGHGDGDDEHHEHEYISEGLIKSFLFYMQTTEALTEGLWKWMILLLNLQEISPFSRVAILDCTAPILFTYQSKFIMYMVLLPLLSIVMFLLYLLGVAKTTWDLRRKKAAMARDAAAQEKVSFLRMAWAHEDENTPIRTGVTKDDLQKLESKRRRLRYRWARIWLFFISVFYFELTEGILKVFRCEKDEATELSYMESQPWVVCDANDPTSPYRIVFPLAIAGLIVYTVGIPLFFFYLLFRHRNRLHNPKVMSWLGMLYEEYQPHLWWFEMTMIARRVLIALLISTVPSESSWGSIGVMMVLMAAMATNIWFRAFVSDAENTVDLAAMCVLMITYIGGVMQKERTLFHDLENLRRDVDLGTNSTSIIEPVHGAAPVTESSALVASWRSLDALEIFIFVLNLCMFLTYLGVLLRPRIISVYHWVVNRYAAWKQKKREALIAQMAARNAEFNVAQTDEEAPQGFVLYGDRDEDRRPLMHKPDY